MAGVKKPKKSRRSPTKIIVLHSDGIFFKKMKFFRLQYFDLQDITYIFVAYFNRTSLVLKQKIPDDMQGEFIF